MTPMAKKDTRRKKTAVTVKKVSSKKKVTPLKKTVLRKTRKKTGVLYHVEQIATKKTFSPSVQKLINEPSFEFPLKYGDNRITLLVRDPFWIYSYWEISDSRLNEIINIITTSEFNRSKKILRVYDVSDINFDGTNAWSYFDLGVNYESQNWYVNVPACARSYCVEIGFLTPSGRFIAAARSNIVTTPSDRMSDVIDEQWMSIDYDRIYALSGGFSIGKSSGEIRELIYKRLNEELSSGWGSSYKAENI